ncbi:MAG TPA: hypothetical protein VMZ90_01400 [Vicinamibacterales bacterium]|nr:hypothetical protein [Vicinamibacterales bacterium]
MTVSMRVTAAMVVVAALVLSGAGPVQAKQAQPSGRAAEGPPVPLKVTVEISRFEGAKKTASLPFVLWVNTGIGGQGNVQMGSDVPIPQASISAKEGTTTAVQSYSYRTLGTNINCDASALGDGLYRLTLNVNDSQVFRTTTGSQLGPIVQNFRSTNSPIMRDGQTVQFAVATDKTSGEVIKLDVTLNLVK